jgi:hypothetical protein
LSRLDGRGSGRRRRRLRRIDGLLKLLDALPDLGGLVNGEGAALLGESEKLDNQIESGDLVIDVNVGESVMTLGGVGRLGGRCSGRMSSFNRGGVCGRHSIVVFVGNL